MHPGSIRKAMYNETRFQWRQQDLSYQPLSYAPAVIVLNAFNSGGAQLQVRKWLRSMVEHEAHHRGQLYLYLGMLDIPAPPLYGLTSEEVRERSGRPPGE